MKFDREIMETLAEWLATGVTNGDGTWHYPGVDLERFTPEEVSRSIPPRGEQGVADPVLALFVGGDWGREGLQSPSKRLPLFAPVGGRCVVTVEPGDEERFRGSAGGSDGGRRSTVRTVVGPRSASTWGGRIRFPHRLQRLPPSEPSREPTTRAALGVEAVQRAGGRTWDRSASSVAELYRSLLAGGHDNGAQGR